MKKILSLTLVLILLACMLSGCGSDISAAPTAAPTQQVGIFTPETTAVATGGLAAALASVGGTIGGADDDSGDVESTAEPEAMQPAITQAPQEIVADEPAADIPSAPAETEAPVVHTDENGDPIQPFATATPQPNTAVSGYSQISGTGLGFRFSYPNGWQNLPGRSTVCYLQPATNGTVYPARVSVSMKQLPHKCNMTRLEEQMVAFTKTILSQYDEATFEVEEKLDTSTPFMGSKNTLATSYLAYDGAQEIEGYFIMTYFERYVFCYHFVSAYEDFEAFGPAMRHMRDSVQAEETELVYEDD